MPDGMEIGEREAPRHESVGSTPPTAPVPPWSSAPPGAGVPAWKPATAAKATRRSRTRARNSNQPTARFVPIDSLVVATNVATDDATNDALERPRQGALRWALVASVSIVVVLEVIGRTAEWFGRDLVAGSTRAFVFGAAMLLTTDLVIFAALRIFATGRAGLTSRGLGLRRPNSTSEAAVLGLATWVCFLLFAATWVTLTTPKDQLEGRATTPRETTAQPSETKPSGGTTEPSTSTQPSRVPVTGRNTSADRDRHVLLKALANHPPVRVVIIILIVTCLGAPIFEELFFRGFLFRTIASRFGWVAGALASGAVFGLAHVRAVPLRATVPLAVMGVALAWLLHATGSAVPGMLVHGFVNALGTGVSAGFGWHTATLIVGTWGVLVLLLFPWLRNRPRPVNQSAS